MLPLDDLEKILKPTHTFFPEYWTLLKDKKIFLTGGTGFFGTWLTESFCQLNESYSLNASIDILTRRSDPAVKRYNKKHHQNSNDGIF